MKDKPLVSILSPCYNVEKFLPQCLDSIVNQTYTNLQIVLIDDGSKDNTWRVLQDYASRDSRIEIYHQENQGVASTRNNLLDKVKGDYVLFVDSDDWIELNMVEFLVSQAQTCQMDIVVCNLVSLERRRILTQEQVVEMFLAHKELSGSLWNKLVRRDLLHGLAFDPRVTYGEDALFVWQILQRVRCVLLSNCQLYHHSDNDQSISHQSWTPEKKGSGSIVWRTITNDTEYLWPQYLDIAKARYAIEDMWGLYYASLAKYPYDEHIEERQRNVKNHLSLIRKSGLVSFTKIVTAYALAYCYALGKLLKYTR